MNNARGPTVLDQPEIPLIHGANVVKMRFAIGTSLGEVRGRFSEQLRIGQDTPVLVNGRLASDADAVGPTTREVEFMKPAEPLG